MALPVSLQEFVAELDTFENEWRVYLNRHTGEFFSASPDDFAAFEEAEDEEDDPQAKLREVLASNDWVEMPSKDELNEYRMMEQFCGTLADATLSANLRGTIQGRGAFGRFRNMLGRHNLRDTWDRFRLEALEQIVMEWLSVHQILIRVGDDAEPTNTGLESGNGDQNDYAIENRKIEIAQRQKQSVFRRRVLQNFEGRCCLSQISEPELLVASHIVPWSRRVDTRLDPANGLLLYCPYDRLFDTGFISFDDELRVVVCPTAAQCSPALRAVLEQLRGQQGRRPIRWAIKTEYLKFHRAEVFRGGRAATHDLAGR